MKKLNLTQMQQMSLNILKDVDAFCKSNGIKYFLAYGTLIGAVRHKGFIPWDDDIDIVMLRPDYDRFCKTYSSESFKLACPDNEPEYYLSFARVYDDVRTESRTFCPWINGKNGRAGVWIDIFPLDSVPEDEAAYSTLYRTMGNLYSECLKVRSLRAHTDSEGSLLCNAKLFIKHHTHPRLMRRHPEDFVFATTVIMSTLKFGSTSKLAQLGCADAGNPMKVLLDLEDYSDTVTGRFEDMEVPLPKGYDNVLKGEYGDYMQLPPKSKRRPESRTYLRFYWK